MPGRPPSGAVVHMPNRVGLEDEFLALQALRERVTARLYELLDILMPDQHEASPVSLPYSGLAQARPGVLLFKGGARG